MNSRRHFMRLAAVSGVAVLAAHEALAADAPVPRRERPAGGRAWLRRRCGARQQGEVSELRGRPGVRQLLVLPGQAHRCLGAVPALRRQARFLEGLVAAPTRRRRDTPRPGGPRAIAARLTMAFAFPFSAIVGQDEMKLAILIAAVDSSVGGVLVFGDRGTGKSTAVRALAGLLPKMRAVVGCPYGCDPKAVASACGRLCRRWNRSRAQRPEGSAGAGAGGRPAARRDRRPRRRRARSRTCLVARRQGVRAWAAGTGAPRLSLRRRGEPARRPSRRSPDRRRRLGRERRRARRAVGAPPGALRPGRQRQPGRGRAAAAVARPLRPVGGSENARRHRLAVCRS